MSSENLSQPKSLRVLGLIPPMTQLNTPYPSTAYWTGFMREQGIDAVQHDLALELVLTLFSSKGLSDVRVQALDCRQQVRVHIPARPLDGVGLWRGGVRVVWGVGREALGVPPAHVPVSVQHLHVQRDAIARVDGQHAALPGLFHACAGAAAHFSSGCTEHGR